MPWPTPQFPRNQVNRAGEILRTDRPDFDEWFEAMEILTNWRSCHGYPINTFRATLTEKLRQIDTKAIIAQRLKRTPSIISKLERLPKMQLARMQDIGGLRAVVRSLPMVRRLEASYKEGRFKHELVNQKDYIQYPKGSGYRGVHLVYRYKNPLAPEYDGLLLQIRTHLQHAWATAVETMGTFLEHALKASEGPETWLDFFSLTGAAFAQLERSPAVPGYEKMSPRQIYRAVTQEARNLIVHDRLRAFSIAANEISASRQSASYHLVVLNPIDKTVSIDPFSKQRLDAANKAYTDVEKRIADGAPLQAVLVSAGSIDSLRRAYPNYFLDTHQFLKELDRIAASRTTTNKRRPRKACQR